MEIVSNLAALIKVKTIVTLVVITIFAVLALKGSITADNVMIVVSTVIAFYFGTQAEKKV
jgi:5-bromo-4-chloroindolyl phosphate hydrolysis protein